MSEANGRVVLICGAASTLGLAVAMEMSQHGVRVALHDDGPGASARRLEEIRSAVQAAGGEAAVVAGDTPRTMVEEVIGRFGRLDYLVNLYLPDPQVESASSVATYPVKLMERCEEVGAVIAEFAPDGAIINQATLPSLYAGTSLENAMPVLRNALTGVTRSACLRFAPTGVRASYIQTGLLDTPEARSFASPRVLEARVPIGRWTRPEEFAKLAAFMAMRATYLTGQGVVLDGGLTAGNAGA